MPTALQRTGDFSDYRDASGNLIPIYDPLTTTSVAVNGATRQVCSKFMGCNGNQANFICPNRLNQVGVNVASIYSLPQFTTVNSLNNYFTSNRAGQCESPTLAGWHLFAAVELLLDSYARVPLQS